MGKFIMTVVIKILKAIFVVALLVIIIALIGLLPMLIIQYQVSDRNGWHNKNEVVASVKDNIDELNILVNNLYRDYGNQYNEIIIENGKSKNFNNSLVLQNNESVNKLFDELRVRYIHCDFEKKRISFPIIFNSGDHTEFYYDTTEHGSYYYDDNTSDITISLYNWRAHINNDIPYFGWYTEKICDDWFYAESYADGFNAMIYIKKDLEEAGKYEEIIEKINQFKNQWHERHFRKDVDG